MSPGAVDIRPARDDEFETLAKIWDASWVSTGVESPEPLTLAQLSDRLRDFRDKGADVFAVISEETPIGLIVIDVDGRKLSQLFLQPDAQGHGLGQVCLSFVTRQLPEGFTLTVAEQNRSAIAFYEREGLVCESRIHRNDYQRFDLLYRWSPATGLES